MGKPHLLVYKNKDVLLVNGNSVKAADLQGKRALHIADLVTEASSYFRAHWAALKAAAPAPAIFWYRSSWLPNAICTTHSIGSGTEKRPRRRLDMAPRCPPSDHIPRQICGATALDTPFKQCRCGINNSS